MKKILIIVLLFTSQKVSSQNDLLGQWYLHYTDIGGVQTYSSIPNSINTLDFINNTEIMGSVCDNGYLRNYTIIDSNTLSLSNYVALTGSCNYPTEINTFLNPYFDLLSSQTEPSIAITYSIIGTGSSATLKLTRTSGDFAFYSRSPLPNNVLPNIWYLNSIVENGIEYQNTFNNTFNINFSLNPSFIEGIDFDGNAICNSFIGQYNLLNPTTIEISGGMNSTNSCSSVEEDNFEAMYTTLLGFNTGFNTFTYEIIGIGNNASLKLIANSTQTRTSTTNEILFSRQALSILEIEKPNTLKIHPNPTEDILYLNNKNTVDYSINSIDGKIIETGTLIKDTSISVSNLNNGIYFLSVFIDKEKQVFKFVKK